MLWVEFDHPRTRTGKRMAPLGKCQRSLARNLDSGLGLECTTCTNLVAVWSKVGASTAPAKPRTSACPPPAPHQPQERLPARRAQWGGGVGGCEEGGSERGWGGGRGRRRCCPGGGGRREGAAVASPAATQTPRAAEAVSRRVCPPFLWSRSGVRVAA